MASRLSFHAQLSSIMDTVARSALSQVCKLVDEDSAELRLELSRLLLANSALKEKVNSLECELTVVRSDAPKLCKSYRTVGVQTGGSADTNESGPPTIEGIFGNDWCMTLWKDRDPYSLDRVTFSPQSSEKSMAMISDHITVTEVKEEDYEEEASNCQQEALNTEDDECIAQEPEQLSDAYTMEGSTCSMSFDQEEQQVATADGLQDPSVQLVTVSDAAEAYSSHIIPIEDDEDEDEDDDVQFVQESQQEPKVAAAGPSQNVQKLPVQSKHNTHQEKDARRHFNMLHLHSTSNTNNKFTCKVCSRTFFHKGTLTHHMKSHKSTYCNICKQHFPHRDELNTHTCIPPVPPVRVSKSCELCGKTFANPSALRIHYVVHTGEKPYSCNLCGKGFTQKGNLKCHLRIHTGERPFNCFKCGKTFTQKVNLNHHLMAHRNREVVGEKPAERSLEISVPEPHQ
ncbi:zinc finger protein 510-like [Thalassophryne amazonica]|uniref:zinc finger protein 510-like n=1 Tax=Thalassophryne amazonica TaxID=390379 RepID=UPI001470CE4E|nr:zinc finger protein 510-like [Thalassophryne amazonica]